MWRQLVGSLNYICSIITKSTPRIHTTVIKITLICCSDESSVNYFRTVIMLISVFLSVRIFSITYLLTPRSRVLLEKLTGFSAN